MDYESVRIAFLHNPENLIDVLHHRLLEGFALDLIEPIAPPCLPLKRAHTRYSTLNLEQPSTFLTSFEPDRLQPGEKLPALQRLHKCSAHLFLANSGHTLVAQNHE